MNKYPLIGGSILAVVLLVLASLTNVIGYQTVQSSNQKIITTDNPKELLFQTIVDMVNNKEIQKVILNSELTRKRFFNPGVSFSVFNPPVLTEKFLKRMYTMGVILFGTPSKSKIQSMLKQYQVNNQGIQKEIFAVIEKDVTLNAEINQLQNSDCDCENEKIPNSWKFPILCCILLIITVFSVLFSDFLCYISIYTNINLFQGIAEFFFMIAFIVVIIGYVMNCSWYSPYSEG